MLGNYRGVAELVGSRVVGWLVGWLVSNDLLPGYFIEINISPSSGVFRHVALRSVLRLLVTANFVPSSQILFTLMM
jgi:hypothetical protein